MPLLNSSLIPGLIGLLVLLIASGLISGAEVALFSLTQKDLDEAKKTKSKSFEIIIELLTQPKKLLASILVANNFINILSLLRAKKGREEEKRQTSLARATTESRELSYYSS